MINFSHTGQKTGFCVLERKRIVKLEKKNIFLLSDYLNLSKTYAPAHYVYSVISMFLSHKHSQGYAQYKYTFCSAEINILCTECKCMCACHRNNYTGFRDKSQNTPAKAYTFLVVFFRLEEASSSTGHIESVLSRTGKL